MLFRRARRGAGLSRRSWLPWLAIAALFVAIRLLLLAFVPAHFDADTFKYLGGADALWHGNGLPPVFVSLPITGATLHAMPGYAWLIDAVWRLVGGPSLLAVGIVHTLVCGAGFFLAGRIAAHCAGEKCGLLVFGVLVLAPSLGWLERLMMPDALAAPLALAAASLALGAAPRSGQVLRPALGAVGSGVLMGCCLLMRTSSQVFLPIPVLVALHSGRGRAARLSWVLVYGLAVLAPLLPWMAHNHATHGAFRLSASTGRNLYFSGLWSNTVDREQRWREIRPHSRGPVSVGRSFELSDERLRRLVERGLSLPQADAVMGAEALHIYLETGPVRLVQQRAPIVLGLFVTEPGLSMGSMSLRVRTSRKPFNPSYDPDLVAQLEERWQHRFSPRVRAEMLRNSRGGDRAAAGFRAWIRLLTLDDGPLLAAFLLLAPLVFGLGAKRWIALWAFVAPPVAYLAVFFVVGAPLYRYQAGLHPFMLASVALGASVAARWLWQRVQPDSGSRPDS